MSENAPEKQLLRFEQFIDEAASKSLARVHQHAQGRNIGMITAHRGENTAQENKSRNKELEHHIRKAGYGFVKVKGRYIENHGTDRAKAVDEHSYLVIGKKGHDNGHLKGFLKKHGEKYKQDSVLHKAHDEEHAHLHGTRDGGFPGKGKTHNVGKFHPNRAGEFHTKMKGKRTFAFEEVQQLQFLTPVGFFSREENLF
jgi:hypothetical protein